MRRSAGGATSGGVVESDAGLAIAEAAARMLRRRGLAVDLVPATVRPRYRAAAFVSIHADGNADPTVAGFKSAPSPTAASARLNASIARRYGQRTGLGWNPSITPDMTNYYAFDARRFRHAIDPATPAVVLETGFLTNAADREVIVAAPDVAAAGIADGVVDFLRRKHG